MADEKVIVFRRMSDPSELWIFKTSSKRRAALAFANILVEHGYWPTATAALAFIYDHYVHREETIIPVN